MFAANPEAFLNQNALQHPAGCEGVIQMQAIDPVHQLEIRVADRTALVRLYSCRYYREVAVSLIAMGGCGAHGGLSRDPGRMSRPMTGKAG